jgi:hypothetical protein
MKPSNYSNTALSKVQIFQWDMSSEMGENDRPNYKWHNVIEMELNTRC